MAATSSAWMPMSEKGQAQRIRKILNDQTDLPLFAAEGQLVMVRIRRRLRRIVPLPPQVVLRRFDPRRDFLSRAKSLLRGHFRVAISVTIGIWPLDCAFREDSEIQ
jgi:hypothetical protein